MSADTAAVGTHLKQRVLSGLILAAIALSAIWVGFPYFDILVFAAVILAALEWRKLCNLHSEWVSWSLLAAALVIPAVYLLGPRQALMFVVVVAVVATAVSAARRGRPAWLGLGILYLGIPAIVLTNLRSVPEIGMAQAFWIVGVVVATDIGAFAGGRAIGGARLAPKISPGKTWAGAIAGTGAAAIVGLLIAAIAVGEIHPIAAILGVVISIAAQLGDLFESAVKRRWDRKDSGTLIPGHGGILDRIDGLLFAALAFALLSFVGLLPIY